MHNFILTLFKYMTSVNTFSKQTFINGRTTRAQIAFKSYESGTSVPAFKEVIQI